MNLKEAYRFIWIPKGFYFKDVGSYIEDVLSEKKTPLYFIKNKGRRKIFVLNYKSNTIFVKAFPFKRLKDKLFKPKKYGLNEYRNLLEAANRGIPVAEPIGYFELQCKVIPILVKINGFATLYLEGFKPLRELISKDIKNFVDYLKLLTCLINKMHSVYYYHLDFHLNNIFVHPQTLDIRIVDLQHVVFQNRPNMRGLCLMISMVSQDMKSLGLDPDTMKRWIKDCFLALGIKTIPGEFDFIFSKKKWLEVKDRKKWVEGKS